MAVTRLTFDSQYNRDLLRIFSAPFSMDLAEGRTPRVLPELSRRAATGTTAEMTFGEFATAAYAHLWATYRAEYLYKNAIARKILLGRHSLATTRMFTEFGAEQSKADVVLVNGTTTAYEIKTELDTLDRLPVQLASYCRVFDQVYVVTHGSLVARVTDLAPTHVGVLELTSRGSFRVARTATSNRSRLVPTAIFDTLRRAEYLRAIRERFGSAPDAPNTEIYTLCRGLFARFSPEEAHDALLGTLRRRALPESTAALAVHAPTSLTALCLNAGFNASQARQYAASLSFSLFAMT